MAVETEAARDLMAFIDASPSPFHACDTAADRLESRGWVRVDPAARWHTLPQRGYLVRGGTLVAWLIPGATAVGLPFRILAAHTDSPNLRIKPRPDTGRVGMRQLGVEVYGGALLNSWLDRDLGISGRVVVRGDTGPEPRLLHVDRPLLRIPQLAIHLDREISERGLQLNRQQHLSPVWGLGPGHEGGLRRFVEAEVGAPALAWDLMLHDLTPSTLLGVEDELLAAGRLDNLASCWAAIAALGGVAPDGGAIGVVCLYDHEEVGSQSVTGADSTILGSVLERVVLAAGGDREDLHRSLAGSWCASVDGAHATHPNYPERHEPQHQVHLDGGPVVKRNANERYATDADSEAPLLLAAEAAGVPLQWFVTRSDLPCGSTIGPLTAARLGIHTVDVGMPMLSMHSARELCGRSGPAQLLSLLEALLATPA